MAPLHAAPVRSSCSHLTASCLPTPPVPCLAGKVRRLAVDATLRAAAPYQISRRRRAAAAGKPARKIYIDQDDLRWALWGFVGLKVGCGM